MFLHFSLLTRVIQNSKKFQGITLIRETFTRETFANFANFGHFRESLSRENLKLLIRESLSREILLVFSIRESLSNKISNIFFDNFDNEQSL